MKVRKFLRKPHSCNFCGAVNGVVFDKPPRVVARLVWMLCSVCGKKHYACRGCLREINNNGSPVLKECARRFLRRKRMQQFKDWPFAFAWIFTEAGATLFRLPGMASYPVPARSLVLAAEGETVGEKEGFPPDIDIKSFRALVDDFKLKSREYPMTKWWSEAFRPPATDDSDDEDENVITGGFIG